MKTFTFDYSQRHCWSNVPCDNPNPLKHGHTVFIRWIREFGVLAPGIVTGFEDGTLTLKEKFSASQNRVIYCENYNNKVLAFLDTNLGKAYVEIHDNSLVDAANKAVRIVANSYRQEEINA